MTNTEKKIHRPADQQNRRAVLAGFAAGGRRLSGAKKLPPGTRRPGRSFPPGVGDVPAGNGFVALPLPLHNHRRRPGPFDHRGQHRAVRFGSDLDALPGGGTVGKAPLATDHHLLEPAAVGASARSAGGPGYSLRRDPGSGLDSGVSDSLHSHDADGSRRPGWSRPKLSWEDATPWAHGCSNGRSRSKPP